MIGKTVIQNKQNSRSANVAGSLILKFSIFMLVAALQGACATTGMRAGAGVEGMTPPQATAHQEAGIAAPQVALADSDAKASATTKGDAPAVSLVDTEAASQSASEAQPSAGNSMPRAKQPEAKLPRVASDGSSSLRPSLPEDDVYKTLSPGAQAILKKAHASEAFREAVMCDAGTNPGYASAGMAGLSLLGSSVGILYGLEMLIGGAITLTLEVAAVATLGALAVIPVALVAGAAVESSCRKKRYHFGLPPRLSGAEAEVLALLRPSRMDTRKNRSSATLRRHYRSAAALSPREVRRKKRSERQSAPSQEGQSSEVVTHEPEPTRAQIANDATPLEVPWHLLGSRAAYEVEYLKGKQSLSPRDQRRLKRFERQVERELKSDRKAERRLKELEQEVDRRLERLEGRTLDAAETDELRQLEGLKQEIELRLKELEGQAE